MSLAEFVSKEFDVPLSGVMLLRHSNESVRKLLETGGTVEDYTFTQPIGSKYDYTHPDKGPVELVVVIVRDLVYGVYRVLGVDEEGTTYTVTSDAHRRFDIERGKPARPARRFNMLPLSSAASGLQVRGWEGARSRTPVQREGGRFFLEVEIEPDSIVDDSTHLQEQLDYSVTQSLNSSPATRRRRLTLAPKIPRKISVTSVAFLRNPDVIAEVLLRAAGCCELCGNQAPFLRKKDGTPYLEVHHKRRLADGGEDTVDNAIAICPNCHRREHYA